MSKVNIRVIKELEHLDTSLWDQLLETYSDEKSIYLTHEWITTWWHHFGKDKKLNILVAEKDDRVVGIIPLMQTRYSMGLLRIHVLETIGSVNCNYVWLVPIENRKEVMTALLDYLEEELEKHKLVLRLTLVPDDSRFLAMLKENMEQLSKRLAVEIKLKTLAPFIKLPLTWDELYRSLNQNRRWVLRKKSKLLQEEHDFKFEQYTAENLMNCLNAFIDLHQRRWQSVNINGVFSNPAMVDFYKAIAIRFHEKNWLYFSSLNVDGVMASGEFGYVYDGKLYISTAGRDIKYSRYSIGHLHCMHIVKEAIAGGLHEIDFLKGDEPYKFYWTKSYREYMDLLVIKNSVLHDLRLKLVYAFLRLCELKQYSPKQSYYLHRLKQKERKELKRMGLKLRR